MSRQAVAVARVRAWAAEEMVGLPANQESLDYFARNVRRIVADTLDVEPEAVEIENLRYEDSTLKLDGFKVTM